uniref:Aldehyde dehydrogenase domain-containing protein n=1 Tax=Zooxanthella nutricula TaxID=1333877 RepID=A0A7S2NGD7_9DINO
MRAIIARRGLRGASLAAPGGRRCVAAPLAPAFTEQLRGGFEKASAGGKLSYEAFNGHLSGALPAVSVHGDKIRAAFDKSKDQEGFVDWPAFSSLAAMEPGILESFVPMEARAQPVYDELKATFDSGKTKPLEWRKQQLRALQRLYVENQQALREALHGDLGGGEWRSLIENGAIDDLEHAIDNMDEWAADEEVIPHGKHAAKGKWILRKEPKGVVFLMGAWNYQLTLVIGPLMDIIAAGNCCVIKPSELAPHAALMLEKLLHQYLDPSAFRVLQGEIPETTALLQLPWAHIMYTGSTAVGKIVMSAAAKNLVPCTLELGGKSPVFVDKTADLALAAERILVAKMTNCGQWCVTPDYILVEKDVEQQLVDELVKFASKRLGSPQDQRGDGSKYDFIQRIVNSRNAGRLKEYIDTSGGKIVFGSAQDCDVEGKFIPFTIISNPDRSSKVLREEIFGPILPVLGVDSVDAAIGVARDIDATPLALYVYTRDGAIAEKVMHSVTSGSAGVNTCNEQSVNADCAFGGVGSSGFGAYHGRTGFLEFSHKRTILYRTAEGHLFPKAMWPEANRVSDEAIATFKAAYGVE